MSFETTAELDLVVSDRALQNARSQIESELGAVEIGATDGGTMSAQSAQTGSGGSRRRRESLRMERSRTEHLEEAVAYLEDIEDAVTEGGLGGGGGLPGSGIFAEVIGAGAETAGDIGVEAGDAVADAVSDVLTGTVASALGNTISSAINGSAVTVEPNPLPVEGGGGSGETNVTLTPDVGFSPTIQPTFNPNPTPDFDLPDLNSDIPDSLSIDRSPLPVQRDPLPVHRRPLPVKAVDPIPVEDVGPITVSVMSRTGRPPESDRNPGFFERAGDDLDNITGGGHGPFGPIGRAIDTINPVTSGGYEDEKTTSQTTSRQEVTVTHSPTYNVDVDPRRLDSLADRIVSEIEDGVERDIGALEDDLDEVERELEELEREITG